MQHATLRSLLHCLQPQVASQARVVAAGLARLSPGTGTDGYLDHSIDQLVVEMTQARMRCIPDSSSSSNSTDLATVDAAVVPLLGLRRALFAAQPVEDQLEVSELDVGTPGGIGAADLRQAAEELGCQHLHPPCGPQPPTGLVVGIKHRILVVRTITIRRVSLSVTFMLDTGAPVSYVCAETLQAFGIDMAAYPSSFVRGEVEGGGVLDLHFTSLVGDKHDLNILGMDYLLKAEPTLSFAGRSKTVLLTTTK